MFLSKSLLNEYVNVDKDNNLKFKLDTWFFNPKKKGLTADAYLLRYGRNWIVSLEGRHPDWETPKSAIMNLKDIKFLLEKVRGLNNSKVMGNQLAHMLGQLTDKDVGPLTEEKFGLPTSNEKEGITVQEGYSKNHYRLMFHYQSHYNGNEKGYDMMFHIREKTGFKKTFQIELNNLLRKLINYQHYLELLNNDVDTVEKIKIPEIYNSEKQVIYKGVCYEQGCHNLLSKAEVNDGKQKCRKHR